MWTRSEHLIQEQSDLSAYNIFNFSAFADVVHLIFQILFHVIFLLQVSPNILSYAMWLGSNCCCTFYVSSAPTLLRLRNHCLLSHCLNSCNCFVDHAMLSCYLHLN